MRFEHRNYHILTEEDVKIAASTYQRYKRLNNKQISYDKCLDLAGLERKNNLKLTKKERKIYDCKRILNNMYEGISKYKDPEILNAIIKDFRGMYKWVNNPETIKKLRDFPEEKFEL